MSDGPDRSRLDDPDFPALTMSQAAELLGVQAGLPAQSRHRRRPGALPLPRRPPPLLPPPAGPGRPAARAAGRRATPSRRPRRSSACRTSSPPRAPTSTGSARRRRPRTPASETLGGYSSLASRDRAARQEGTPWRSSSRRARHRAPARLHPPQGRVPQAAAPDRGPGPRPAAHGRGREVLHRHPHPGLGHDEGAPGGLPRPARGAPEPLRRRGRDRPAAARPRRRCARPPRPSPASSAPEPPSPERNSPMSTATYTVVGMTCGHCVNAVTEEVAQVPGRHRRRRRPRPAAA